MSMALSLPQQKTSYLNIFDNLLILEKPKLTYLQVIPHFGVVNGRKIENIVDGIHSLYKPINERIEVRDKKLILKLKEYFNYAILIEHEKISFHFGIPEQYKDWMTQRLYSTWNNQVTIIPSDKDYLDSFDREQTTEWLIQPRFKPFKAFVSDYRENAPIPSLLSTNKDLQQNDRLLLELTLSPINDAIWKDKVLEQQNKYKYNLFGADSSPGKIGFLFDKVIQVLDGLFAFLDLLIGIEIEEKSDTRLKNINFQLSSASRQKVNYNGFEGKTRILAQAPDPVRREMMAKTMTVALKDIAEDNEFVIVSRDNKPKNLNRPKIYFSFGSHIYSSKEVGQLFQLPERKWQEEYPVEKVDIQEVSIPTELLRGGIPIGKAKYKGNTQAIYWNNSNRDIACLPKCSFGNQGTGKTSYLANYAVKSAELGRGVIVLDGIKDCELADTIRDNLPKNFPETKIIELDFSNLDHIIPLSWNEIDINTIATTTSARLKFSNNLAQELIKFLDSLIDAGDKLTPRMRRYLSSAGILTFSLPNTTIMNVLECLTDYDKRHELITRSGLPSTNKLVMDLLTLDSKDGGTNLSLVQGIVDRMDLILGDYVLCNLFSTKGCSRIDFRTWIKNNCVILCKMPQTDLNDATIKTLTTFLISKIWFAKLSLGTDVQHTLVICDEVHRTSLKFENIREMRKYGLEYFFSAHQPADFKHMLNTLKSSGCSFMLLSTTKDNIKHFESEIYPFSVDEVLKTKKFHALCIVNYDREFVTFDVELPGLFPKENFIDRSYLTSICSKKLGVQIDGI